MLPLFVFIFQLSRHLKVHTAPKCETCSKPLGTSKHICKSKPVKPVLPENEELKCKICSTQLETRVAWGYHMWKHTKDPSYIQTADATQIPAPKSEAPKPDIKPLLTEKIVVPLVTSQQATPLKTNSNNNVRPLPSFSAANFGASKIAEISDDISYPRAPEAHATSYTQISQPLCLQTSRLVVEEPIKPLNMQVIINANQS